MLGTDRQIKPSLEPPDAVVQLSQSAPIANLLPMVRKLDSEDARAEKLASRFGYAGGIGVVWLLVAFVVMTGMMDYRAANVLIADVIESIPGLESIDPHATAQVIMVVLLVGNVLVAVLFTIAMFVVRRRYKRFDIDDRKLATVEHLLGVLTTDVKPTTAVGLVMDFRGYHRPDAKVAGGGFQRKWLSTRLPLVDRSTAELSVATHCKRKTRAKNKYTKVKDKLIEELTVEIRPPKGTSFAPDAANRLRQRFNNISGLRTVRCKVASKAMRVVFRTPPALRIRGRAGWTISGHERLVDGPRALGALMRAHRAMRSVLVAAPRMAPPQGGYPPPGYAQGMR